MSTKVERTAPLGNRLDQIERCLVLAETVVNVLQSDCHLDHDSIVRLLGVEAASALDAVTELRQRLKVLERQHPANSVH